MHFNLSIYCGFPAFFPVYSVSIIRLSYQLNASAIHPKSQKENPRNVNFIDLTSSSSVSKLLHLLSLAFIKNLRQTIKHNRKEKPCKQTPLTMPVG
jgi:hypothetical protein